MPVRPQTPPFTKPTFASASHRPVPMHDFNSFTQCKSFLFFNRFSYATADDFSVDGSKSGSNGCKNSHVSFTNAAHDSKAAIGSPDAKSMASE